MSKNVIRRHNNVAFWSMRDALDTKVASSRAAHTLRATAETWSDVQSILQRGNIRMSVVQSMARTYLYYFEVGDYKLRLASVVAKPRTEGDKCSVMSNITLFNGDKIVHDYIMPGTNKRRVVKQLLSSLQIMEGMWQRENHEGED